MHIETIWYCQRSGACLIRPASAAMSRIKHAGRRLLIMKSMVRNHSPDHVLSTTLETPWNTPHSRPSGYAVVGRQLGLTLYSYLADQPQPLE